MTLITNKRIYQFLLDAKNVKSMDDPAVFFFETRFIYPDDISSGFQILDKQDGSKIDFQSLINIILIIVFQVLLVLRL